MLKKIMVVDDSNLIHKMYHLVMSRYQCEIVSAMHGAEALELLAVHRDIQLILLDINMPVMNGLVTLHEIMNLDPTARVAMVTCIGSQSIVLTALKTGARDFVTKPMDDDGLLSTVGKLLS